MQNLPQTDKEPFLLESERLYLREMHPADLPEISKLFAESPAMTFFLDGQHREKARTWIDTMQKSYRKNRFGFWIVYLKIKDTFIGHCGIVARDYENIKEAELGYAILRQYWNRGYATEAANTCIKYAFESLGLKRLIAFVEMHNAASVHVAENVGMHFEQFIHLDNKKLQLFSVYNPNMDLKNV